ncbi:zf-HC2 domain-containing protein [bacterium]|nr:zf-HC2 domain-containing protein [bacterium]
MKPCKQVRPLFIEALYDELDPESRENFRAHLRSCVKCRKAFRKMKRALGVMNQRVRVEPDQQFWDGYYDRLEKRMQQEKPKVAPQWTRWAYRAAAVILLIGIGVILGRFNQFTPGPVTRTKPSTPPVVQAKLEQRTQDFLGRSEVLLLGMVNFNAESDDASAVDITKQKALSQDLIQEASYLKKELSDENDGRLEKLVGDLELILMQIANLEEKEDLPEIELVKNGVDRKGLLLKINLEQMRKGQPRRNSSKVMSNEL